MPAPTFLASGADALSKAAYLLFHAQPLMSRDQWGTPVTIQPGTLWDGNRIFIGTGYEGVYYADGDRLYSQSTADFIRDTYLMAFAEGAARASWLLPIAQAEMAIVMAFAGAAAGAIGTAAGVTVFLSKVSIFYVAHKDEIEKLSGYLRPVLSGLQYFRNTCPRLYSLMVRALAEQVVAAAAEGVSATDIAVLIASLLGGLVKAEAGAKAAAGTFRLSMRAIAKVGTLALVMTTLKRAPGAVVHGAQPQAAQIQRDLQAQGISITEQEALVVAAEACVCNPVHRQKLEEMVKSADLATPLLELLAQRLKETGFAI